MNKKYQSMILIAAIYIIGAFIAYICYLQLNFDSIIVNLLIADVIYTLFIYFFSNLLKNASLYDPYWSVIPPLVFLFVMIEQDLISPTNSLLFFAILIWSIRLTYNWAKLWTGFGHMDWRYLNFKEAHPKTYFLINLFGIQLFPTIIVYAQLAVGIEFLLLQPSLNMIILIGALLIIAAAVIQYISDTQMQRFKEKHQGEKLCIDEGLWRFSRHPNYLGEVTVWWGLYIMYLGATMQIDFYILAPLAMTGLFYFISIPLMENKILKTRPEYSEYQEKVSKLLFLPRRESHEEVSLND